jgi:hypothetical protein
MAAEKPVHQGKLAGERADDGDLLRFERAQDVAEPLGFAAVPTLVLVVDEATHRTPFHHFGGCRGCGVVRVTRVDVHCVVAGVHARAVGIRGVDKVVFRSVQLVDWEFGEPEEVVEAAIFFHQYDNVLDSALEKGCK